MMNNEDIEAEEAYPKKEILRSLLDELEKKANDYFYHHIKFIAKPPIKENK